MSGLQFLDHLIQLIQSLVASNAGKDIHAIMVETGRHLERRLTHGVNEVGVPLIDFVLQLIKSALLGLIADFLFIQIVVEHHLQHAGLSDTSAASNEDLNFTIHHNSFSFLSRGQRLRH